MITTKNELRECLSADKKALGYSENKGFICLGNEILKYQISMRYLEYYNYLSETGGGNK